MGRGSRTTQTHATTGGPKLRKAAAGRPGWLDIPDSPGPEPRRWDLPPAQPLLRNLHHADEEFISNRLAFRGGDLFLHQVDGQIQIGLNVESNIVTLPVEQLADGILGALHPDGAPADAPVRLELQPRNLTGLLHLPSSRSPLELDAPQVGVLVGVVQRLAGDR